MGIALALMLAACGGDDDKSADSGPGSSPAVSGPSVSPTSEPSASSSTPAAPGGEATILIYNEQATMDPVRFLGSGANDAQRAFAVYGALVGSNPKTGEVSPILAKSLTPNADFTVWTLVLRDGIVFSDDSPFDAEAVRVNWERIKDPESRSPAIALARSITSLDVVDPVTLTITLGAANAHFANGVSRQGLNYIASAKAIAAGHDLANTPIGAGPFVMDSWVRDDRMVLSRNPKWVDAPAPALDKLTFRVLTDEEQRVDAFLTGDADILFATDARTIKRATEESTGDSIITRMATGQVLSFNTTRPPLDDPRVRRAVTIGFDKALMSELAEGEGVDVATHFSVEDSQWFTEDGAIPAYDPKEAQRLLSEYAAEKGGPVRFSVSATQTNRNQAMASFIQTAFGQMNDVEVEVRTGDLPTFSGWALQGDYDVTIWGYPTLDPDPGLYNAVHSGLPTNIARYQNPEVDAALDEARATNDLARRKELYAKVYKALATDLPFLPLTNTTHAFIASDAITGLQVYEDGILRVDKVARKG